MVGAVAAQGVDDDGGVRTEAGLDQVVVDSTDSQQGGDRGPGEGSREGCDTSDGLRQCNTGGGYVHGMG